MGDYKRLTMTTVMNSDLLPPEFVTKILFKVYKFLLMTVDF